MLCSKQARRAYPLVNIVFFSVSRKISMLDDAFWLEVCHKNCCFRCFRGQWRVMGLETKNILVRVIFIFMAVDTRMLRFNCTGIYSELCAVNKYTQHVSTYYGGKE